VRLNAYRHGLSVSLKSGELVRQIEHLARRLAGDAEDGIALERARTVAEAEFDLARVRRAKVALIERVLALGAPEAPDPFKSVWEEQRFLRALLRGKIPGTKPRLPQPPAMPVDEPDKSAEAIRRALPELLKLDRYEQNARGRRDRAAAEMIRGR
jgi:hypothetical protein